MSWASEELAGTQLGDERLNRRLVRIVEDLSARPGERVPVASRDKAALQGTYSFWSNQRVEVKDILEGYQKSVVRRASKTGTVLAVQDTSELDYSEHRKGTRGIEPISNPEARRLKLHTVLAVNEAGVPLGILEVVEWQSLYMMVHRMKVLPAGVPSLRECVRWIAKKGGFLWRKGDGEPGIKTLWRGWVMVSEVAAFWQAVQAEMG